MLVFSVSGTKPAPIPWILCGPETPSDSTGEDAGSTATIFTSGFFSFKYSPVPVMVPPVPTPATKISTVFSRPFLNYMYSMVPYVISDEELIRIFDVMKEWFREK